MEDKQYMYAIITSTGYTVTVQAVCKIQEKAQSIVERLNKLYEDDPLYETTAHWEKVEVVED